MSRFDLLNSMVSFRTVIRCFLLLYLFFSFASVWVNVRGSEDTVWESAVSFHQVEGQTQGVRLVSK